VAEVAPHIGRFPWHTLAVNLLGCVAIGVAARRLDPLGAWWRFAVTGLLGGFTTFSAFANETRLMLAAGDGALAAVYVVATVLGGFVAVEISSVVAARSDR
jgi:CrcB protein